MGAKEAKPYLERSTFGERLHKGKVLAAIQPHSDDVAASLPAAR